MKEKTVIVLGLYLIGGGRVGGGGGGGGGGEAATASNLSEYTLLEPFPQRESTSIMSGNGKGFTHT